MLTRCPRCKTSFRVLAEHLKVAHGRVQCGRCYIQFDALATLYDDEAPAEVPRLEDAPASAEEAPVAEGPGVEAEPMESATAALPETDEDITDVPMPDETSPSVPYVEPDETPSTTIVDLNEVPDTLAEDAGIRLDGLDADAAPEPETREIPIGDLEEIDAVEDDEPAGMHETNERPVRRESVVDEDDVLLQDFGEPIISREDVDDALIAAQAGPAENRRGHPFWGIAAALLVLLGAAQFVWYQRENIVERIPALRPVIEAVCTRLGCELKPRRDLDAIKVLARDVRDHPRFKDSLLVNATLENEAPFTQAYPILQLTLYDAAGKMIGVRRFKPDEYLDSSIPIKQGMKPGQPVYIVLEIARPAEEAVSFEFKFY